MRHFETARYTNNRDTRTDVQSHVQKHTYAFMRVGEVWVDTELSQVYVYN